MQRLLMLVPFTFLRLLNLPLSFLRKQESIAPRREICMGKKLSSARWISDQVRDDKKEKVVMQSMGSACYV